MAKTSCVDELLPTFRQLDMLDGCAESACTHVDCRQRCYFGHSQAFWQLNCNIFHCNIAPTSAVQDGILLKPSSQHATFS